MFNETKYKTDFRRDRYDQIAVTVPKGEKKKIKAAAEKAGQSVNSYVVDAVYKRMEKEKNNG